MLEYFLPFYSFIMGFASPLYVPFPTTEFLGNILRQPNIKSIWYTMARKMPGKSLQQIITSIMSMKLWIYYYYMVIRVAESPGKTWDWVFCLESHRICSKVCIWPTAPECFFGSYFLVLVVAVMICKTKMKVCATYFFIFKRYVLEKAFS